jgi:hypothetical protein
MMTKRGLITMTRYVALFLFAVANFVFFQNCGGTKFGSETDSRKLASESTGQPYDGKIFVTSGLTCSDGTYVQSRIVMKSATSAVVVRENCQEVSKQLTSSDFALEPSNPDVIIYGQQTFKKELPWTPIPILSSWHYQLTGNLRANAALVQNIDLFETTVSQIQSLKQAGQVVLCNVSSGTYENWRPDASSYNPATLGNNVSGSPGERWVDTRSTLVRSILVARLDLAQQKGCDGIALDSSDGYQNNPGFPLTVSSQIDFNQYLAFAAHDRHLIVALKNTADLAASLVNAYDLVIAEECFRYNECAKYQSFVQNGKALLGAEFTAMSSNQCDAAKASSISLAYFSTALDGSRYEPCP